VNAVLGTVNRDFLFRMADCLAGRDTTAGLGLVQELVNQGKDVRQFTKDLTEHFRNLLMVDVCRDSGDLVPVSEQTLNEMREQAARFGRGNIIKTIEQLTAAEKEMKWTSQPRLLLELAVIRNAGLTEQPSSVAELAERLNALERALAGGTVKRSVAADAVPAAAASNTRAAVPAASKVKPAAPVPAEPEKNDGRPGERVNADLVKKSWPKVLEKIKKVKISCHAFLMEGNIVSVENDVVSLGFTEQYAFHKDKVEQPENRQAIEKVLMEVTGHNLKLKCKFTDLQGTAQKRSDQTSPEEDPLIKGAIQLFGGEVIEIKD
jgi:DNA polymerase-3 subunit gamma/tau